MVVHSHCELTHWRQLVEWLSTHVGPVLNSVPIVHWQGTGWELTRDPYNKLWRADIDSEELVVLFKLVWP